MATVAQAIRATRGKVCDLDSAVAWSLKQSPAAKALEGRSLVYYNGAFSPPTRAHAHIARTIASDPDVDALWLDPEPARPGKLRWLDETLEARVAM
eukprot:4567873-Amphidinium_carterae.1